MIELGLVARRTSDIDIHLPSRAGVVQLWAKMLRPKPIGAGHRAERHFRSGANWWTFTVRTPAKEVVKVDIGTMLPHRPAAMVRLSPCGPNTGAVIFVDAYEYGVPGAGHGSLVPMAPLALARQSTDATRRYLTAALSGDTPMAMVRDELVLVTHPRDLIFRKAHSVLAKPQRRRRASDLVDLDALCAKMGPQSLIALLQQGGVTRRRSDIQLRERLADEIATRLAVVRDEDLEGLGCEVRGLRGRLARWSQELRAPLGGPRGAAEAPTPVLWKGSEGPGRQP
jgi:hypothetical protein